MQKFVVANWREVSHGSIYTLHEVNSWDKLDCFLAIDALGDPTDNCDYREVHSHAIPQRILDAYENGDQRDEGYLDDVAYEKDLKALYDDA